MIMTDSDAAFLLRKLAEKEEVTQNLKLAQKIQCVADRIVELSKKESK